MRLRQVADPDRYFLDFDPAAPGGGGGGSIKLFAEAALVSIDSVHRNDLMPRGSTGELVAEAISQTSLPRPFVLEAYNVERSTASQLAAGIDPALTIFGRLLALTAASLSAKFDRWEQLRDPGAWHIRVYLSFPDDTPL